MSPETDPVRVFFADSKPIETERLLLRQLEIADAQAVFEYGSLPEVTQFLTWETHQSLDDTLEFLRKATSWRLDASNIGWGITLRENGKVIGSIGLHNYEEKNKCAEMGYVIAPPYWNMGYVTEAAQAVIQTAFASTDLNRIQAHHYPANTASGRVMEKAGMQYEGILRKRVLIKGEYQDIKMYAILRSDKYGVF